MPLCTTATRPFWPRWGWALTSLGAPWVAQRVCPMPVVDGGSGCSSMAFSRLASLPARLSEAMRAAVDDRDAGGVVAAVLQAAQSLDDDVPSLLVPDVAHDSAHGRQSRSGDALGQTQAGPRVARMSNGSHPSESSPYVELDRDAWAALGRATEQPLTPEEIDRVRGLGDELDLDEVQQVYLPLSRLLSLYVKAAGDLHRTHRGVPAPAAAPAHAVRDRARRLGGGRQVHDRARAAADARPLARAPQRRAGHHRRLPAAQRRAPSPRAAAPQGLPGVLRPQGAAQVRHRHQVGQGRGRGADRTPTSSTTSSPTRRSWCSGPTSSSSRASTCSSPPGSAQDGRVGLAVSDFFDFSVYVDAATSDIRRWYTDRFLRLRETAFRDPASYFARYASLSHDEAVDEATRIWDEINGPNLKQNVQPTRSRATLVLRKDHDHSVRWVRLRKL